MKIEFCDCHSDKPRHVKFLRRPGEGNGGLFLCRMGWIREMVWRKDRNWELSKDCQFHTFDWHEAPEIEED